MTDKLKLKKGIITYNFRLSIYIRCFISFWVKPQKYYDKVINFTRSSSVSRQASNKSCTAALSCAAVKTFLHSSRLLVEATCPDVTNFRFTKRVK